MMQQHPPRPTWIEIDHGAIANNVRKLKRRLSPATRLMGVVKANAYGHGLVECARTIVHSGANALAVATLGEALAVRAGGIDAPVLVLGYTPVWQARQAAEHKVTLTLFDAETAVGYAEAAALAGIPLSVHVKVNTGMNRLGMEPENVLELLEALHSLPTLHGEGIFTHFATSDEMDKSEAYRALALFAQVLSALSARGLRPPLAHCANSAALLTMPESHLDMARAGIALYGLDPDVNECPLPDGFRPVLTWKAIVSQVRWLHDGDAVSYGREYIADHAIPEGVIPVGYADGFPRRPYNWGYVLVGGQPAPILGRVCMDQCVVDLSAPQLVNGGVQQGDEVVLIGKQGDREIRAEDAAAHVQTNNYDIVSRILSRVPRVHLGAAGGSA